MYGFKFNASYKYPIYNILPKSIHFSAIDTVSVSQISFYQDHSNYFYDTNVAMNSYLRTNINLLTLVESKSIKKNNYSHKFLISLFKKINDRNIEVGYMYHFENIPTFLNDLEYIRSAEIFSGKFKYKYFDSNIKFSNQSNFEVSNNIRYNNEEIEYQAETVWNELYFDYSINNKISLTLDSQYKSIFSRGRYTKLNNLLISLSYSILKHKISFGNLYMQNKNSFYLDYLFSFNDFTIFLKMDKEIFLNIDRSVLILKTMNNKVKQLGFSYNNNNINTKVSVGENFSYRLDHHYYFYLLEGEIQYDMFGLNINYMKNNSAKMFINYCTGIDIIFSPIFADKKYRLYVKARINRLGINPNFTFNQNHVDLVQDIANYAGSSAISILDGEIGVLFKYFKISLIQENMFKDYYQYSSDNILPNSSNYLVNITWLFED